MLVERVEKFKEFYNSLSKEQKSLIYAIFRLQDKSCILDFDNFDNDNSVDDGFTLFNLIYHKFMNKSD